MADMWNRFLSNRLCQVDYSVRYYKGDTYEVSMIGGMDFAGGDWEYENLSKLRQQYAQVLHAIYERPSISVKIEGIALEKFDPAENWANDKTIAEHLSWAMTGRMLGIKLYGVRVHACGLLELRFFDFNIGVPQAFYLDMSDTDDDVAVLIAPMVTAQGIVRQVESDANDHWSVMRKIRYFHLEQKLKDRETEKEYSWHVQVVETGMPNQLVRNIYLEEDPENSSEVTIAHVSERAG